MAASATSIAGIVSRNPRESVALFVGAGAISIIFANALFMQKGPHPAPIFAPKTVMARQAPAPAPIISQPTAAAIPAPLPRPDAAPRKPVRNDPIAQLLAPSNRVLAVQRVLTDYGYGQIRPTGVAGADTEEAIKKFERSKKMPVTGALSDQLVKALSEMSGQRID
jgi:peptidoglycan hydrolase-like protein with peptidoglycan-binding domain